MDFGTMMGVGAGSAMGGVFGSMLNDVYQVSPMGLGMNRLNEKLYGSPGERARKFMDEAFPNTNSIERLGGSSGAGSIGGGSIGAQAQKKSAALQAASAGQASMASSAMSSQATVDAAKEHRKAVEYRADVDERIADKTRLPLGDWGNRGTEVIDGLNSYGNAHIDGWKAAKDASEAIDSMTEALIKKFKVSPGVASIMIDNYLETGVMEIPTLRRKGGGSSGGW